MNHIEVAWKIRTRRCVTGRIHAVTLRQDCGYDNVAA